MKTLRTLTATCLVSAALAITTHAADLTGDWKWTSQSANGPVQMTATLVQKDGALSGTVTGRQGPAAIADTSIKDGTVAFSVTRGAADKKMVIKYQGKIDGDTITGTIERPGPNGAAPAKTEWKAMRSKSS